MNSNLISILILGSLLSTSCGNNSVSPKPETCTSLPDSVKFTSTILPIINKNCNTGGCHSGSKPDGNLNLEASKAFASLTNPKKDYINLQNPSNSMVYSMMMGGGTVMPPSGQLSVCSTNAVLKWIEQGGK